VEEVVDDDLLEDVVDDETIEDVVVWLLDELPVSVALPAEGELIAKYPMVVVSVIIVMIRTNIIIVAGGTLSLLALLRLDIDGMATPAGRHP
jgi:hypothetical protein